MTNYSTIRYEFFTRVAVARIPFTCGRTESNAALANPFAISRLRKGTAGIPYPGASMPGEKTLDINVRERPQVRVVHLRGELRMGLAVDNLHQATEESVRAAGTGA